MSTEVDSILETEFTKLIDKNSSIFKKRNSFSQADRWRTRSSQQKKRTSISSSYEANHRQHIENKEAESLAKQLVEIKENIKKLEQQEALVKQQLLGPIPELGWLEVSGENQDYIVEKLKIYRKPKLNTDKTLKLIRKIHGNEAARVILEECSTILTVKPTIYVRPFPKRMYANIDMQSNSSEDLSDSLDYKPYNISKDNS